MTTLLPDLVYHRDEFRDDLALEFDAASGRITRVAHRLELAGAGAVPLRGRAVMPGLVNAHSHAFQRLIRGATQWRPADLTKSDFWSWREAMYSAALRLSPDDVYAVSRLCFMEMLQAGITTVGEFHYLHNDVNGEPYTDRRELALRVVQAAEDVGIRICLLNCCYATGGIGMPLTAEQRRFATPDLDEFIGVTESLGDDLVSRPLATVGVAPHSIRAVPRDWIRVLHAWAVTRDLPFHMHVSEQPAEVDACVAILGARPVELLHGDQVMDSHFTAVHATHVTDAEVAMLAGSGATVCACPATERDLGDGYLRARDILRAGGSIALGSDSQTVIDHFEEARLVEYIERLRNLERVMLTRRSGDRLLVAPVLVDMMTRAGAQSLRLPCGTLEADTLADFIAIDLNHTALAGWTRDTLPAMLALSAPANVVADVWVGGRQVISGGMHASAADIIQDYGTVATP